MSERERESDCTWCSMNGRLEGVKAGLVHMSHSSLITSQCARSS